jgi:hypothetical protein
MTKYFVTLIFVITTQSIFAQLEAAQYSIKNLIVNTPYTDMSTSFWGKRKGDFCFQQKQ